MNTTAQRANFAANLKWLCGLRTSIAEVCRATGINRQQFNRYLAGTSVPSALIMRRICGHFGVPEELMFRSVAEVSRQLAISKIMPGMKKLLREVGARVPKLISGYYYSYQLSTRPGPKRVLRMLFQIREVDDLIYFMEGYAPGGTGMSFAVYGKPAAGSGEIRAGLLLQSCSTRTGVSRAALEYLGERPNLRKALTGCGYLYLDAPELCSAILDLIMPQPGESVSGLDAHPNFLR